jgi:maleate isomerase
MDGESDGCALELSDAHVDVMGYACLVAIMSIGLGYHRVSQERLEGIGLKVMRAKKIVILTPYIKPLTKLIVDYIANEGYDVLDYVALEIPHNLDVAGHDQNELHGIVQGMEIANADVLVLSDCVQMPSLAVVPKVEALTGKPVVTASIATAYALLRALNLEPIVPGAGALLSGAY